MRGPGAAFGQTVRIGQQGYEGYGGQQVSRQPIRSQSPGTQIQESTSASLLGSQRVVAGAVLKAPERRPLSPPAIASCNEPPRSPVRNSGNMGSSGNPMRSGSQSQLSTNEVTSLRAADAAAAAAKAAELARQGQAAASEAAKRTAATSPSSEFVKLVRSLEERVDLMAQMQRSRGRLPKRDQTQDSRGENGILSGAENNGNTIVESSSKSSLSPLPSGFRPTLPTKPTPEQAAHVNAQLKLIREETEALRQERDKLLEDRGVWENDQSRLTKENGELWARLREQGNQIAELTTAIQKVKAEGLSQLQPGLSDQEKEKELQEVVRNGEAQKKECDWLREQLKSEKERFLESERTWMVDKERMEKDIQQLTSPEGESMRRELSAPGNLGMSLPSQSLPSDVDGVSELSGPSLTSGLDHPAIVAMQQQMLLQTQRIGELERKLKQAAEEGEDIVPPLPGPSLADRPTIPMPNGRVSSSIGRGDPNSRLLPTGIVGPSRATNISGNSRIVAPFSRHKMGLNLVLSNDGYTASRTKGCRQSVVIGEGPIPRSAHGWYFEVEIKQTVLGWVGGLGIGVSLTSEVQLRRVPDKAWRLPKTWIAGYWGRVFCDSKEYRTQWRADELKDGDVVGLLITSSGELLVFVNGQQKCRVEAGIPAGLSPLFPVVDVFAATASVTLKKEGEPPPPPWDPPQAALSPPDSPASSMRSRLSFMEDGGNVMR